MGKHSEWDKLSQKQKNIIIEFAIQNGVSDINDIRDTYSLYAQDAKANYDYDMAAAKASGFTGDKDNHYPNVYKKPNHATFGDDSMYHTPQTPGGRWTEYPNDNWTYEPSDYVLNQQGGWNEFLKGFANQEGSRAYNTSFPVFRGGHMLPEVEIYPNMLPEVTITPHKHAPDDESSSNLNTGSYNSADDWRLQMSLWSNAALNNLNQQYGEIQRKPESLVPQDAIQDYVPNIVEPVKPTYDLALAIDAAYHQQMLDKQGYITQGKSPSSWNSGLLGLYVDKVNTNGKPSMFRHIESTGGPLYPFSFYKNPYFKTPVVRYDNGGVLGHRFDEASGGQNKSGFLSKMGKAISNGWQYLFGNTNETSNTNSDSEHLEITYPVAVSDLTNLNAYTYDNLNLPDTFGIVGDTLSEYFLPFYGRTALANRVTGVENPLPIVTQESGVIPLTREDMDRYTADDWRGLIDYAEGFTTRKSKVKVPPLLNVYTVDSNYGSETFGKILPLATGRQFITENRPTLKMSDRASMFEKSGLRQLVYNTSLKYGIDPNVLAQRVMHEGFVDYLVDLYTNYLTPEQQNEFFEGDLLKQILEEPGSSYSSWGLDTFLENYLKGNIKLKNKDLEGYIKGLELDDKAKNLQFLTKDSKGFKVIPTSTKDVVWKFNEPTGAQPDGSVSSSFAVTAEQAIELQAAYLRYWHEYYDKHPDVQKGRSRSTFMNAAYNGGLGEAEKSTDNGKWKVGKHY